MQEETKRWLTYADENLKAAKVLLESELYNPCLHNVQQSIEKVLKSIFIEKRIPFKKTHNILELRTLLEKSNISIELTEDECDFQTAFTYLLNTQLEALYQIFIQIEIFVKNRFHWLKG